LGLPVGSTLEEVKKRKRSMVLHYHPDRNKEYADAKYVFAKVMEAFDKIMGIDDSGRNNLEISTDD
jgi:DnaJ-class molecular chaperone